MVEQVRLPNARPVGRPSVAVHELLALLHLREGQQPEARRRGRVARGVGRRERPRVEDHIRPPRKGRKAIGCPRLARSLSNYGLRALDVSFFLSLCARSWIKVRPTQDKKADPVRAQVVRPGQVAVRLR